VFCHSKKSLTNIQSNGNEICEHCKGGTVKEQVREEICALVSNINLIYFFSFRFRDAYNVGMFGSQNIPNQVTNIFKVLEKK
jgi:hypothetical protein